MTPQPDRARAALEHRRPVTIRRSPISWHPAGGYRHWVTECVGCNSTRGVTVGSFVRSFDDALALAVRHVAECPLVRSGVVLPAVGARAPRPFDLLPDSMRFPI